MMRYLRPRYTLRTLLVLATLAAALFGWESYVSWKEERAVQAIEKLYGSVEYEHIGAEWLRRFAGEDYLRRVSRATFHEPTIDAAIPHLKQLAYLREVLIVPRIRAAAVGREVVDESSRNHLATELPNIRCNTYLYAVPYPGREEHLESLKNRLKLAGYDGAEVLLSWTTLPCSTVVWAGADRLFEVVLIELVVRGTTALDWSVAILLDHDEVVDVRRVEVSGRYGEVDGVVCDLNGDARDDLGFRCTSGIWGLDERAKTLPGDNRSWLAAYEITPTGFKSLFEEESADEAGADSSK